MEKLQWLWTHRVAIGAGIVAAGMAWTPFATFLARLIPRPAPAAAWWKRALFDLFVDTPALMASLGHSGIFGGLFNLPGVPSRAPEQNPTPTASKAMRGRGSFPPGENTSFRRVVSSLAIPLALAAGLAGLLLAWSGCGTTGAAVGQALGACELGALPKELEGVLAQVLAAAMSPAGVDWEAQLGQAVAIAGPAQGQCLLQAAATWFEQMTSKKGEPLPAYVEAQKRLRAFMEKHAPQARLDPAPVDCRAKDGDVDVELTCAADAHGRGKSAYVTIYDFQGKPNGRLRIWPDGRTHVELTRVL